MPTIVLDLLKYVFLAVLYIFMARAVKAVYVELRPAQPRPTAARKAPAARPSRRGGKPPGHVTVVEGGNLKGKTFGLDDELLIGRGDRCQVVLDDQYASQVHARIFSKGGSVMVEDMGSTNGTYVNRRKLTSPTEVQRGDQVKIGKTILELRR